MRVEHPEVVLSKMPVFKVEILAVLKHEVTRKIREAIEIRERKPAINRTKGWIVYRNTKYRSPCRLPQDIFTNNFFFT